jgi:hypothetical protein
MGYGGVLEVLAFLEIEIIAENSKKAAEQARAPIN